MTVDVFAYMDIDSQQQIIEQMSNKEVAEILDDLFIDDAVDFYRRNACQCRKESYSKY